MRRSRLGIAALAAASLLALDAQPGASFEITRYTIAGGGGTSSGSQFTLTGTLGQIEAGTLNGVRFTLRGGFWQGGHITTGVDDDLPAGAGLPLAFRVYPARPSPFNPSTVIAYDLPAPLHVRMEIYNPLGRLVAVLVDGPRPAGRHAVRWDGGNQGGQRVASGIYLVRTVAGEWSDLQKVTLLE
jgi:hypothetical protein